MEILNAKSKQRKRAIKQVVKKAIKDKDTKLLFKVCYGITLFLRITACLLGSYTIYYAAFISDYGYIGYLRLIITFLFPYMFSYIPAVIYHICLSKEYFYRRKESVTISDNGFVYAYHDDQMINSDGILSYNVDFNKIDKFDYCEKTKVLDLYGEIAMDVYENGKLKESHVCRQFSMLDVYDRSIHRILGDKIKQTVTR